MRALASDNTSFRFYTLCCVGGNLLPPHCLRLRDRLTWTIDPSLSGAVCQPLFSFLLLPPSSLGRTHGYRHVRQGESGSVQGALALSRNSRWAMSSSPSPPPLNRDKHSGVVKKCDNVRSNKRRGEKRITRKLKARLHHKWAVLKNNGSLSSHPLQECRENGADFNAQMFTYASRSSSQQEGPLLG